MSTYYMILLGRKLGTSSEGWPSQKACKLISKHTPDTTQCCWRAHKYATKPPQRLFQLLRMHPRHTADTD